MVPERKLPALTEATTLLPWLLVSLSPMNRTRVKELLRSGRIHVEGISVTRHDFALHAGMKVTVGPAPVAVDARLPIVYEDAELIVVDKPSGLLTVATEVEKEETAFVRLLRLLESRRAGRPFVVHRIDRGTSGLLVFARSAAIRDLLQSTWDQMEKGYLAVVEKAPPHPEGRVDDYLLELNNLRMKSVATPTAGAQKASSRYRLLKQGNTTSLVEVILETGRKHQIRVHLAELGCPIVGDRDYGAKIDPIRRVALHASFLNLLHPRTKERLELTSPLPRALARLVE